MTHRLEGILTHRELHSVLSMYATRSGIFVELYRTLQRFPKQVLAESPTRLVPMFPSLSAHCTVRDGTMNSCRIGDCENLSRISKALKIPIHVYNSSDSRIFHCLCHQFLAKCLAIQLEFVFGFGFHLLLGRKWQLGNFV